MEHHAQVDGLVFECSCGIIERWREPWQATAAFYDHRAAVRRGEVMHWGVSLTIDQEGTPQ